MKRKVTTIDNLARMVQTEFAASIKETADLRKEMNLRFDRADERFDKMDRDVNYLFGGLDVIQREIADIKEKLNNVVYRHELESLRARVASLEKKVNLRR